MPTLKADIESLVHKAEVALQTNGNHADKPSIDDVLAEVQSAMTKSADARKTLGPLIGKLRTAKSAAAASPIDWTPMLEGHLAIGHRPRIKMIRNMCNVGVTHVLTILSESEGAKDIGREVQKGGLDWIWLPLGSAEPPSGDQREAITRVFDAMRTALNEHGRIYVHCSAGIHRTGMMTYAFLRYTGLSAEEATAMLSGLRRETADGVGDERKQWGDQFGLLPKR